MTVLSVVSRGGALWPALRGVRIGPRALCVCVIALA